MKRLIAATVTLSFLATPAFACGMKRIPEKAIALNDLMKQVNEAEEKVHAKTEAPEQKVVAEVEADSKSEDAAKDADAAPAKKSAPES